MVRVWFCLVSWMLQDKVIRICNKTNSVVLCYGTSQLFYIMSKVLCNHISLLQNSSYHYITCMITWYTFIKAGMIKLCVQRLNDFFIRTNTIKFDHKSNVRNNRYFDLLKGGMCRID